MIKEIKQAGKKALTGLALMAALAQPAAAQDNVEFSGAVGARVASAHIVDSGVEIGDGPVQQDYIAASASYNGFKLTGLVWHDFSLKTKSNDETDYWLTLNIPTQLEENGIGLAARYKRFIYPSHPEWGQDNIAGAVLSYSGSVNAQLHWDHLFPQGNTEEGDRFFLKITKPLTLHEGEDLNVKLIPSFSTSYEDNFFGRDDETHRTLGLALKLKKGKYSAKADLNAQKGIGETGSGADIEDMVYGGISASVGF